MATLFKTTGEVLEVAPANGEKFTLNEMTDLIGGWIEYISGRGDMMVLADEEGRLKGLPRNNEASARFGIELVGNVVYCSNKEF